MKSECSYTRTHLPRYLTGHLFKLQRMRVERHLAACPVCSSEFDALRRIHETRHFLRDLETGGGVGTRARSLGSAVVKLFYRPLLLLLIVASVAGLYRYVVDPILHDPDLERLDAGLPPPVTAPAVTPQTAPSATPVASALPAAEQEPKKETLPAAESLVVTITVEKEQEKESIKQINEAMKEHTVLRTMRFNDKVREVSGNLTADELYVLFNRIQDMAKVTYKRSRLRSAGGGELVPVVLKLQIQSTPTRQDTVKPAVRPGEKPAEAPVEKSGDKPAENPVGTTLKSPGAQTAPSRTVQ